MKRRILIVLGAPNSPKGILSSIARNRLDLCFEIFKKNDLILCTGGWGKHFNTSVNSHSYYAKEYLKDKGIPKYSFLEDALSSNTVDDAVKTKKIISKYDNPKLIVITSDFHIKRVKLIFNEIFHGKNINFIKSKNCLPKNQLLKIIEHETKSINSIKENGFCY